MQCWKMNLKLCTWFGEEALHSTTKASSMHCKGFEYTMTFLRHDLSTHKNSMILRKILLLAVSQNGPNKEDMDRKLLQHHNNHMLIV
jgi:hypothetical protein